MTDYKSITKDDFDFSAADVYRKMATLLKSNIEIASEGQEVVTHIGGIEETKNTAGKGDHIITGVSGERYIIKAEKFPKLYEQDPSNPDQYISKNVVRAIQVNEPVEIMAPWGEMQRADTGGWVCQAVANAADVYLIEKGAFDKSYAIDASAKRPGIKAVAQKKTFG